MTLIMTRKEYELKYGVAPVISTPLPNELKPAPRVMTIAEYQAEYGPEALGKKGFFTKVGDAINEVNPFYNIPKNLIEGSQKLAKEGWAAIGSKTPTEAGKHVAGLAAGGVQAAFSIPFGLFESATNLPGLKQVKNFLMNPESGIPKWAGDKISDWKPLQDFVMKHPNAPEVASDIATTVLGLAGVKEVSKPGFKNDMLYVKSKVVGEPPDDGGGGSGLLGLEGRRIETRNTKINEAIAEDIIKVKTGVGRNLLTEQQSGKLNESALRLAETDALAGTVNQQGKIDPVLMADAVKRYETLRVGDIDRSLVKNLLKQETERTNGATAVSTGEIAAKLIDAADKFTGSFRLALDKAIANEVAGMSKRADEFGRIKLEDIQEAKVNETKSLTKDYGKLSSNAKEWKKAKAFVYKTIIENNSKVEVPINGKKYTIIDVNAELGKYLSDIELMKSLIGRAVEGGRLGKHIASISGNIIGFAAGSMFGHIGSAVGSALGGELARGIKGEQMKRTFGVGRNRPVEKSPILKGASESLKEGQGIDLRVSDTIVKAPKDIPKSKEIYSVEKQIEKNVEAQKKAIKAKDFTLVASLKEIYKHLVEYLKDLVKKIKETPNKEGGFAMNLFADQSNNLGKRNAMYKNNKNATTNAIFDNYNTLGEKIQATGEKKPTIKLKRDVQVTTLSGEKVTIPEAEILKTYESGGKALLKDGREYVVSKSQYENIKNNSLKAEAKDFAPELKGTEETVLSGTTMKDFGATNSRGEKSLTSVHNTKYSSYQLPDGKNYKEILIKAPTKPNITKPDGTIVHDQTGQFTSSHWNEPNVISHLRMNERTYQGKKVAFMEELQSDWAREGRSKGFTDSITKDTAKNQGFTVYKAKNNQGIESYFIDNPKDEYYYRKGFGAQGYDTEGEAWNRILTGLKDGSIPSNPLLKNWQELSIKRALKDAVDSKAEYFSWINGEQTNARYNLATYLKEVEWHTTSGQGTRMVTLDKQGGDFLGFLVDKNGKVASAGGKVPHDWIGKKLDEVLGKGLADKIMEKESGTLSGGGLKFGGEWANNLYDKQVGNIVSDLTGAKVEKLDLGLPIDKKNVQWFVDKPNTDAIDLQNLSPNSLKVGQQVVKRYDQIAINRSEPYIITDILRDGKFKAVQKKAFNTRPFPGIKNQEIKVSGAKQYFAEESKQTFDISTKKTIQQGIKLTPEIKAIIKGEAPKL